MIELTETVDILHLQGSPKGSPVGEFSVNIADYVGATKACSVSFPFKNSNSDAHLHVSTLYLSPKLLIVGLKM